MANSASSSSYLSCPSTFCSESTEGDGGNTPPAGESFTVSTEAILNKKITSWTTLGKLGSGAFGDVFKVQTDDGSIFAVKETRLSGQGNHPKERLECLEREIKLYTKFEHENIVQYIGTVKDKQKLYVVLEFMSGGSLLTHYKEGSLKESDVSEYTRQILNGLNYLHGKEVIHRDIKCANILVDASGFVKLADFGLAKETERSAAKTIVGTPNYIAPEVLNNENNESYGLKADIWSLGCTVLEMLTRKPPYSGVAHLQVMKKIGNGVLPDIPANLSSDSQDFIRKCLQVNPEERPSAAELLCHSFVKKPQAFARSTPPR